MQENQPDRRKDGRPHSVLDRLMLVLGAFGCGDRELRIAELSRRTGLPKSTVHRVVGELAQHGLIERRGRAIALGLRLFELGEHVPRKRDLCEAAVPYMTDLHAATRQTVHLAVLDGLDVLYLAILRQEDTPPMPSRIGSRLPAHATGVGKAMLAVSPPAVIDAVLRSNLQRVSERTIVAAGLLRAELAAVRQRGVAYDYEESGPGVVCAASAVYTADGTVAGALSISGWSARLDVQRMAPAVRTAALALSRDLGATSEMLGDPPPASGG